MHDLGPTLGALAICVTLFIINSIQLNRIRDQQHKFESDVKDGSARLERKLEAGLKEITESIDDVVSDLRDFTTSTARDNKEIATTLVSLSNSIDRVVSHLIEVIREVEKP